MYSHVAMTFLYNLKKDWSYLRPSSLNNVRSKLHKFMSFAKNGLPKLPFLAILDPKKSKLPRVCPDKIFFKYDGGILLLLKVTLDVRDMLDTKKYV